MNAHAANSEVRGHLVEEADIQRLLCVESHIKVNLAPSALALRSTNLLSVWWGSGASSPFQRRATNPQDLFTFTPFPITWPLGKRSRGSLGVYVPRVPIIAQFGVLCPCEQRPDVYVLFFLCDKIFFTLQNTTGAMQLKPVTQLVLLQRLPLMLLLIIFSMCGTWQNTK